MLVETTPLGLLALAAPERVGWHANGYTDTDAPLEAITRFDAQAIEDALLHTFANA